MSLLLRSPWFLPATMLLTLLVLWLVPVLAVKAAAPEVAGVQVAAHPAPGYTAEAVAPELRAALPAETAKTVPASPIAALPPPDPIALVPASILAMRMAMAPKPGLGLAVARPPGECAACHQ
jgi:hypothetical protein